MKISTDSAARLPSFSRTDRDSLNAVVRLELVDSMGLLDMLQEHGEDIFEALQNTAEAHRHTDNAAMAAWYKIRDAVRYVGSYSADEEDVFGFKLDSFSKAAAVLNTHGIRFHAGANL